MRAALALLAALLLALAGCGGGDGGGGDAPSDDPVAQVPSGLQEKVRAARDPQASEFPKPAGKTLQALADSIGGGPEMGLAGSVFLAGQENRVAFGVIDKNAGFLYGKTALYYAKTPGSPAKGPFVAPADVLVTDAPYRSEQAATEADPFAAVYAAQVPFKAPGQYSVMAVSLVDGKPVAAPGQLKVIAPADDKIPEVGEPAPKVQTDTVASAGGDVEAIDTRRPTSDMHGNFADAVGKKPVALLFATPQLCQSRVCGPVVDVGLQLRSTLRRPGGLHPPGGLHRQRPEQGAAQAAAGVQPADGAVAVRGRQGREDHRAARGLVRARRVRAGAEDRAVSRRARLAVLGGVAAATALTAAPAQAHGLVQRTNLPIPEWLFGWAAAIVLVASFAALAVLWPRPRLQEPAWRALPGVGRLLGSRPGGGALRPGRRRAARRRSSARATPARAPRSTTSRRRSS